MTPDPMTRYSLLETTILARRYREAVAAPAAPPLGPAEAAGVGVASALALHDRLVVHHRRVDALLARGAALGDLVADQFAAGSWLGAPRGALQRWAHAAGVTLTSTLAGSELALAPGAALAQRTAHAASGGVAVALFDAASLPPALLDDTLATAIAGRLPLLLVAVADRQAAPSDAVDGDDVEAVHAATRAALAAVRGGGRARTLWLREHGSDAIARQTERLLRDEVTSPGELGALHQRAMQLIARALAAVPAPDAVAALERV